MTAHPGHTDDPCRRFVLTRKEDGAFVKLDRHYYPPEVLTVTDPLDADRFRTRARALETIDGVFKQSRENYVTRMLKVTVA